MIEGVLEASHLQALAAVPRAFEELPPEVGLVQQAASAERFERGTVAIIDELAEELEGLVHQADAEAFGLEALRFAEAIYQRYEGTRLGVSPHRDSASYKLLVAILTLEGSARFSVVSDRDGNGAIDEWIIHPGSLVLVRAPGFQGVEDGRPMHSVGKPHGGTRLSLTLRHRS